MFKILASLLGFIFVVSLYVYVIPTYIGMGELYMTIAMIALGILLIPFLVKFAQVFFNELNKLK